MEHHFNVAVAAKVGLNAATVMEHIRFFVYENQSENRNFHDGKYWTYNTINGLLQYFPYFTPDKLRTAIEKLINAGLIEKANFNRKGFDNTTWYTITEAGYELLRDDSLENRSGKNPNASGKNPNASGKNPNASGKNPNASGKNPNASGKNPNASGKNPNASGKNPRPIPVIDNSYKPVINTVENTVTNTPPTPLAGGSASASVQESIFPETDGRTDEHAEHIEDSRPSQAEKKKHSRFVPPTVEEVSQYCRERNNCVDPEEFVNFYACKGWKVGKSPMIDWKAAVRTWEAKRKRELAERAAERVRYGGNNFCPRTESPRTGVAENRNGESKWGIKATPLPGLQY